MANFSASLFKEDKISVRVNDTEPHNPFIVIDIGGLTIYLHSYGGECIRSARELGEKLLKAADEAEILVKQTPEKES